MLKFWILTLKTALLAIRKANMMPGLRTLTDESVGNLIWRLVESPQEQPKPTEVNLKWKER